jgi:hypothetical protein
MRGLAPTLGLTLQSVELRDRKDIDNGFAAIIRDRAEGVIVDSDPVNGPNQTPTVSKSYIFSLHLEPVVTAG